MEKQVHPPKMGAIGTNVPKNTEEKEEDFLDRGKGRGFSGDDIQPLAQRKDNASDRLCH